MRRLEADTHSKKESSYAKDASSLAIGAAFALTAWIGVVALAQGSSSSTTSHVPATTVSSPNDDPAEDANDDQGENEDADDQGENEDADDHGENEDD